MIQNEIKFLSILASRILLLTSRDSSSHKIIRTISETRLSIKEQFALMVSWLKLSGLSSIVQSRISICLPVPELVSACFDNF